MRPERLLLIDNRDSFTWNLAQAFLTLGVAVEVRRAEETSLIGATALDHVSHVVVGPGSGGPEGRAVAVRSLELCRGRIPWLGVCLGHQILASALGLAVEPTGAPVHGKRDWIHHDGSGIFADMSRPFPAARYHSLAVTGGSSHHSARMVAWTERGEGMALGIPGESTWGVQFHPESFLTPEGPRLLASFLAGVECPGPVHLERHHG